MAVQFPPEVTSFVLAVPPQAARAEEASAGKALCWPGPSSACESQTAAEATQS